MKGLLVLNGQKDAALPNAKDYDCIAVTDGAYELASVELSKIDYVVGDFDSLGYVPKDVSVVRLEREKNSTDGEVALILLMQKGCDEIDIYWAYGLRIDHTICNITLLNIAHENKVKARIISNLDVTEICDGEYKLNNVLGKTISLLPFTDNAHIIDGEGFEYLIKDLTLTKTDTVGISNVAVLDDVYFKLDGGKVLVIVNK